MTSAECTSQTWYHYLSNQLLPAAAAAHPKSLIQPQGVTLHLSRPPLSVFCSVSVCHLLCKPGELMALQGTILMSLQIHRPQNTATTKTSPGQKQSFAYTQTHTETMQHAPADSAGPGGKRSCLSLSSPTVSDNKSKKELPALS